MLWLKHFDVLAKGVPKGAYLRWSPGSHQVARPCVLRPGGLGDMVLLTRAFQELGMDLSSLQWISERRNQPWLEYLGVPSINYDERFLGLLAAREQYPLVINTEQLHGLAALFSARLVSVDGVHCGFSFNPRADLFSKTVFYLPGERHELESFKLLIRESGVLNLGGARTDISQAVDEMQKEDYAVVVIAGLQAEHKALQQDEWLQFVRFASRSEKRIVVLGHERDRPFSEELNRHLQLENLVGRLSFSEVVEYIRRAKRVYSVDSGLVHVADYFGVPCSALYRSSEVLLQWRPTSPESEAWVVSDFFSELS